MPLPTRITLPPSGRTPGGLLGASRPLPDGVDWWRGVTFASSQCVPPQVVGSCTDGAESKVPQALSDAQSFDAFGVLVAIECTTMGKTGVVAFAGQSLDVVREYAISGEFLTGAASGNPSLADAEVYLSAATNPTDALACLEQASASALSGRLAFIHVAPAIATALLSDAAIYKEGRLWYTASGNIVVIAPGYDGREPVSQSNPTSTAPAPGDPLFMYATGEVYAAFGQREDLLGVERGVNTLQGIAEEMALAVFDPCFNIAIDSGVEACSQVS